MVDLIAERLTDIAQLCRKYDVARLDLFGSAARAQFDAARSDIDLLVEFHSNSWQGASSRYFGLKFDLEDLFSREVDLVEAPAVSNPYFAASVNRDRRTIYAG